MMCDRQPKFAVRNQMLHGSLDSEKEEALARLDELAIPRPTIEQEVGHSPLPSCGL